ncbi:hypothetical protein GCM10009700_27640 [Brevibacterium sanguinis]|uniref:hypothetical protein n=1 Tax=Brevibacterium sanguinis TaxID=232444 RepID=UPI0031D678CA
MNKIMTAAVSAIVGLSIGMTGIGAADAKPAKPVYTKTQMNKCAGAVMEADAIINGGDKSLRKSFNKKRNACAKVVNGF